MTSFERIQIVATNTAIHMCQNACKMPSRSEKEKKIKLARPMIHAHVLIRLPFPFCYPQSYQYCHYHLHVHYRHHVSSCAHPCVLQHRAHLCDMRKRVPNASPASPQKNEPLLQLPRSQTPHSLSRSSAACHSTLSPAHYCPRFRQLYVERRWHIASPW